MTIGVWTRVSLVQTTKRACTSLLYPNSRAAPPKFTCLRFNSTQASQELKIGGKSYPRDEWSNVTPTILSKIPRQLHLQPNHPLCILRTLIENHFPAFRHINTLSPVVTTYQNFDELGFPSDHPGRALTDTYYINKDTLLRTHTSAHEVEVFKSGADKWLLTADVYRRDEIDSSHHPVFHQVEAARTFAYKDIPALQAENARMAEALAKTNVIIEDPTEVGPSNPYQGVHRPEHAAVVNANLKLSLNSLMLTLFGGKDRLGVSGEPLRIRWIEAYFPFTSPSYEVEVFFQGKWLEILGCGVVQQATLDRSQVAGRISWAFGLGLERIAMVLFGVPDIRLFWSTDPRFLGQFSDGKISTFRSYSKFPPCYKDVSFWVPEKFHENDFCDVVRDAAGDLVEDVKLIDEFVHPRTQRKSLCYRINYRSMDRSLSNEETNSMQNRVIEQLVNTLGIELR